MRLALAVLVVLFTPVVQAQGLEETNLAQFAPLDLPAPNGVRAASGAPGAAYWQNRADYRITAAFDTTAHEITGTVRLTYTNHSPDTLRFVWLQLEQNLFARNSRGAGLTRPGSRWEGAFEEGGYDIGTLGAVQNGLAYEPRSVVDDTRMRVDLNFPLAPHGGQVVLTVPYSFVSPEYGADRMGRFEAAAGTVYEFAQWYPRVAVYDDVNGWNALPYLGQGEFYLEYGDFDVELTLPASMIAVATGAVQNPAEVWTAEQQARLARAQASVGTVGIVEPDEVGERASRPAMTGTTTWRYHAENVRDFAWAASAAFILDGAGYTTSEGNDVLVLSAYPAEGVSTDPDEPGWERATEFARHTIRYYSETWYPYPYPVAISVGGIVGGMEYPMIQFSSVNARHQGLSGVIDHELGHNWFPMIVGSDERRHAWMDEGFNTFLNVGSNLDFYDERLGPGQPGYGTGEQTSWYALTRGDETAGFMRGAEAQDQPMMTYPDRVRGQALGFLAYFKPAKGLLLLRDHILGPERFDAAFRTYIRRWAFKHPQPADFFRSMEDVSGEDLDWFWRGWYMTTEQYDAAVARVEPAEGGTVVTVENRAGLVFPVDVEATFADGATARMRVPVEAFVNSDRAQVGFQGARSVTAVRLDPDGELPDGDRTNDTWTSSSPRGTR